MIVVRVRVETKGVFEDGIQRVGGQSKLRPVQTVGQPTSNSGILRSCLHWRDDEGVQCDLVQEPVVARSREQVLAKLFRNSVAKHTVT